MMVDMTWFKLIKYILLISTNELQLYTFLGYCWTDNHNFHVNASYAHSYYIVTCSHVEPDSTQTNQH